MGLEHAFRQAFKMSRPGHFGAEMAQSSGDLPRRVPEPILLPAGPGLCSPTSRANRDPVRGLLSVIASD
jgi:hypothetical protein